MSDPVIRLEIPPDAPAIRAVNEAAFGRPAEADLVTRLWEAGRVCLSLVADIDGEIAGHILFSDVSVDGTDDARMVGLAPMAVLPGRQNQGIGSALVRRGLEDCREFGYRGIIVLGHPAYYPRFGFVPASRFGISCEFDAPDEAFMAIDLAGERLPGGRARYAPEFAGI